MGLTDELVSQFAKIVKSNDKKITESTVFGTVVDYNGSQYVRLDGSELLTPVTTTAAMTNGDRVTVMIKNHSATVTGNISSPSASNSSLQEVDEKVGDYGSKITEVEILVAGKVSTDEFNAQVGRIDTLYSDNVIIKDTLTTTNAKMDNLEAEHVTINGRLEANEADIETLRTTKLDAEVAEITYATIDNLEATDAKIYNLEGVYGDFEVLTTQKFEAVNAKIDNFDATYATISDLDVERGRIDILEAGTLSADSALIKQLQADIADIDTLIFGSASGDVIQTSFANSVIAQLGNAQIKSAMIESISADQITAGDIITNNVKVMSEDGKLIISDETIQIKDNTRVRVQIGKDSIGDYSINVWDADGNLMFSEGGITDNAIKEAIIRDDMVSDTANISAHKLNIESLFEEINGSEKTIKSSKIFVDSDNQTLDVAFTALSTDVSEMQETVSSQGTALSVVQGQISSKVWQQDINTAIDDVNNTTETLTAQYSSLDQTVDEINLVVASHTTELAGKAEESSVTEVRDQVTELEANLGGFKTTVSDTYATKTSVKNIEIGGRNLVAGTSKDTVYAGNKGANNYKDVWTARTIDIPLGEEYIVSFDAKADVEMSVSCFFYDPNTTTSAEGSTGSKTSGLDGHCPIWVTTEWKRYWVKWTQTAADKKKAIIVGRNNTTDNLYIRAVKFEAGNKATSWTPAPEDVDSDIATAQETAEAAQAAANQNAEDMATIVTNFNSDVANLQTQIDGSITTWFYEVAPTDSNKPAVDWTTTDLKNTHLGDLYYDTITGYCYRYQVQNNVYSWQRITDTDVTKALSDAQAAQDTADQKRRVFYTQPTVPYDLGDLWVQGSGGDILRCQAAKTSLQTYSVSDWVVASKYTDDTAANSAMSQANTAKQAADDAQADIDNLKIGGRNILPNSKGDSVTGWKYAGTIVEDDVKGYCVEKQNTTLKETYIGSATSFVVEPSTEYTFSADVWANEYLKPIEIFWLSTTFENQNPTNGYVNVKSSGMQALTLNNWKRIVWKFTTNADDYKGYIRFDNNGTLSEGTAAILRVANLKLEKGNRVTDWTPAPEDLEDRVTTAETNIIQNRESITLVANRTTTVENKFAGYSTTEQMNSAIEQKANSITSSVSSTYATKTDLDAAVSDFNSSIEQTANSITSSVTSSINNIKVGGQNLLLHTGGNEPVVMKDGANYSRSGATTSVTNQNGVMTIDASTTNLEVYYRFMTPTESSGNLYALKAGEDYILSGKAQVTTTSGTLQTFDTRTQMYGGAGWHGDQRTVITTTDTADWIEFVAPIHIEETAYGAYISVQLYYETGGWTGTIKLKELKLERGTRATDWSPAPEDVETDITTAQSTADGAQSSADNAQADIDNLVIGGRNLLLNSKTLVGSNVGGSGSNLEETYNDFVVRYRDFSTETSGTTDVLQFMNVYPEKYGDDYTLSFYAKGSGQLNTYFYGNTNYVPITKCVQSTGITRTSSDGSTTWTLTDTWTRYWVVWTLGATGDLSVCKHVLFRLYNGGIANLCGFKLEKGNRVSDWTPAPEDMATSEDNAMAQEAANKAQETANSADEKAGNAHSLIQQLSNSISMLVTDGNGESLMTQTEDGWVFSTGEIQNSINATSESLNDLTTEVGDIDATVNVLRQSVSDLGVLAEYVKITTYEGEPCIELGETDSDFKLLITNTRILFMEGSSMPAYVTNQSLHIEKAVIEHELQQGEFVWKIRSNGNLGLMWKGGTS